MEGLWIDGHFSVASHIPKSKQRRQDEEYMRAGANGNDGLLLRRREMGEGGDGPGKNNRA